MGLVLQRNKDACVPPISRKAGIAAGAADHAVAARPRVFLWTLDAASLAQLPGAVFLDHEHDGQAAAHPEQQVGTVVEDIEPLQAGQEYGRVGRAGKRLAMYTI